ncbi:hypothetical protein [Maritalea myrionectae]|uniref:hypothetical protein n=1 Tax=Maritalea myrionectae TaxID=454601 RepID=UPI0012EBD57B|nr:hypothetical protein [Maritalea myrionectae]
MTFDFSLKRFLLVYFLVFSALCFASYLMTFSALKTITAVNYLLLIAAAAAAFDTGYRWINSKSSPIDSDSWTQAKKMTLVEIFASLPVMAIQLLLFLILTGPHEISGFSPIYAIVGIILAALSLAFFYLISMAAKRFSFKQGAKFAHSRRTGQNK